MALPHAPKPFTNHPDMPVKHLEGLLREYLELPDVEAIMRATKLADSPQEATRLWEEARSEAWRLRLEKVRTWDNETFAHLLAMVSAKAGAVPDSARRRNPIIGPLLEVYYDERVPAHKARIELAEREAAKVALKRERAPKHRKGAMETNRKREHRLLLGCARSFKEWAITNGRQLNPESAKEFPKPKGMSHERLREFLGSLTNALSHPQLKAGLCEQLQTRGFPNITDAAVSDCLNLLEKNTTG